MFNVRASYGDIPIDALAVQCPKCKKWFAGYQIDKKGRLEYKHDIKYVTFTCPLCEEEFGGIQHADEPVIEEVAFDEVYKGCLERKIKIVWE